MNIESWSGRANKVLVTIPSVSQLRYDKFKQNCKSFNFVNQSLEAISSNMKKISSSVIHLYHYSAEGFEDEFTSAAGDAGLNFSSKRLV